VSKVSEHEYDEIRSLVSEICGQMGKNTASDYDGIENTSDIILYLKSIKRDLPVKSLRQSYILTTR